MIFGQYQNFSFIKMPSLILSSSSTSSTTNSLLFIFAIILIINLSKGNNLNDMDHINHIMNLGIPPSSSIISTNNNQQYQQKPHQSHHDEQEIISQQLVDDINNENNHDYNDNYGYHLNEKRSWQKLHGSWGKRANNINDNNNNNFITTTNDDFDIIDSEIEDNGNKIINNDEGINSEYDDSIRYSYFLHNQNDNDRIFNPNSNQFLYAKNNEQKRGWKSMSGAWGKRLSNGDNWNKFRGSWGKREPGWNNLKGLWGKRATNWNKLQNAWGKRNNNINDNSDAIESASY